jgi:peptide methionine sulfoxide reductase MsrA
MFLLTFLLTSIDALKINRACFGAGCYWGTEKFFKKDFNELMQASGKVGKVTSGAVGFMSASPTAKKNPSYR